MNRPIRFVPAALLTCAICTVAASPAAADTVPATTPTHAVAPDQGADAQHIRLPFHTVGPVSGPDMVPTAGGPVNAVGEARPTGPDPRPQGQGAASYKGLYEVVAPDRPVARAFPNPSTNIVTVRAGDATVSVEVYDVKGRRIADVTGTSGDAAWDGRDLAGRTVTPGVYFARVRTGEAAAQTVRIVRK